MLSLEIEDFVIQLKDGTINNVGGPRKAASIRLFDVSTVGARAFGDNRIKLVFADGEGNDIEIALFPEEVESLLEDISSLRAEGTVSGFEE